MQIHFCRNAVVQQGPDIWHAAFTGTGPGTQETVAQILFPPYSTDDRRAFSARVLRTI